jgi:hypothetical protein
LFLGGNKFLVVEADGDDTHDVCEIIELTFGQIEKYTGFEPINEEVLFISNCRLVDSTRTLR